MRGLGVEVETAVDRDEQRVSFLLDSDDFEQKQPGILDQIVAGFDGDGETSSTEMAPDD
jgi:hypothetical protein